MLLLCALGLIVFMGFGFVVSGIAKNESTIPPLANIVTLPQFLLSGTFFGIEAFPTWLQPICKALPLTYLNDAMRKVAFEGAGMFDITHQLGIILIWGVLVYALAVKIFQMGMRKKIRRQEAVGSRQEKVTTGMKIYFPKCRYDRTLWLA